MPIGVLFWVLMIIWLLFGGWVGVSNPNRIAGIGGWLLPWICIAILGWKLFGSMVQ